MSLIAMIVAASIGAPPQYNATVLPQLDTTDDPNFLTYTSPHGLNDLGAVTGSLGDGMGFVWSEIGGGQTLQAQMPEIAQSAFGNAINSAGTVAGVLTPVGGNEFGPFAAFTLTAGGVGTSLPTLGAQLGAGASDINDAGLVVGAAETAPAGMFGGPTTSVYWLDGVLVEVGGLGGETSGLRAVNDSGLAVGAANTPGALALQPFRWTVENGIEVLPQLVKGVPATPEDVNDSGLIVGRGGISLQANRPVYWTPDKVIHELPGLSANPFDIGVLGVNNDGVMVGHEWDPNEAQPSPRVWIDDEIFDLRDYIVDLPDGITLIKAVDINDAGQIVIEASQAVGQIQFVSVLLTPAGCTVDCNGDGELNVLDFVCYQGLFQSGDDAADCDGNGELNVLDFVCFQAAFQAGC